MNVYVVTGEFAVPQIGIRLHVADTMGKVTARESVIVGGAEYESKALHDWVGSPGSLDYLLFSGVLPDPVAPGSPDVKSFSKSIGAGADFVTVAGAAWGFVPSGIAVAVLKPAGGDNLFATVRGATITADGFTVDLSAPTPGAGYVLAGLVME